MATLTQLEELLRQSPQRAHALRLQVKAARHRLEKKNIHPQSQQQYQQNTLLLEALIQAEDIIKIIYYRYHNHALVINDELYDLE